MTLLIPQMSSILCVWQKSEPHPHLGSPSQSTDFHIRGSCHGLLQRCLYVVHISTPDILLSLPQEQGMILCLELCPAPESCGQVSYENTGDCPFIPGRQSWIGNFQTPCLTYKRVITRIGTSAVVPWKRSSRKEFCRASSTSWNASQYLG